MRLTELQRSEALNCEDPEDREKFAKLISYFDEKDGWSKYVRVHIYTIDNVFNNWVLYPLRVPVVHVGVQIEGFDEFTFNRQGIVEHSMGGAEQEGARIWTDTAYLGDVTLSKAEIRTRIDSLRDRFGPGTYRLTSHNCVTFVSAVAETLGCDPIPEWSQRLSQTVYGVSMGQKKVCASLHRLFAHVDGLIMEGRSLFDGETWTQLP